MEKLDQYKDLVLGYVVENGLNILIAIVVYLIGSQVIKAVVNGTRKVMDKRDFDPTLSSWLRTLISISLKAMLIISVLGMVGISLSGLLVVAAIAKTIK